MFDDVSFRYGPNLAGVFDLSFVVAAGKTVAFVGPSGSGKSTTARLACRLYDVAGGSVRVGGIDIRGVKQASLRRLTVRVVVCVHADTRDGLGRYPSACGRVETIETIELFIAAS